MKVKMGPKIHQNIHLWVFQIIIMCELKVTIHHLN